MTNTPAVCDTCGKPAIMLARDVFRYENWKTGYYECRPHGTVKAGCDEHPVTSETFDVSGPPPPWNDSKT
jgi:hypothetical protein